MQFRIWARLRALALAGALAAGGCSHPVQEKLEGRWLGDSVENFDDAEIAAATGWAKGTCLEFDGSTITVGIPAEEPRSGRYKIARVHDSDVELAITRSDGQIDTTRLRLDDEHSIRWLLGNGRAIVMRRHQ